LTVILIIVLCKSNRERERERERKGKVGLLERNGRNLREEAAFVLDIFNMFSIASNSPLSEQTT
jgi:hypothetical protein